MEEFYDLVEHAIDCAFEKEMYLFKCYTYLKHIKATRRQVREFIDSSTAKELALLVYDLEQYIKGGSDNEHCQRSIWSFRKTKSKKVTKVFWYLMMHGNMNWIEKPGRKTL